MTGVTTMTIDAGLDTGDILLQQEIAITEEDTSETVAPKLAAIGAELMVETLRRLQSGTITARPQDDAHASLAPILKKEDGRIDFARSAWEIYNRFRGFKLWPGAFTTFRGRSLNVTAMKPATVAVSERQIPQSQLLETNEQLLVGCGENTAIEVLEVQPEGKKRMSARDFIHGYRPKPGEMLGQR